MSMWLTAESMSPGIQCLWLCLPPHSPSAFYNLQRVQSPEQGSGILEAQEAQEAQELAQHRRGQNSCPETGLTLSLPPVSSRHTVIIMSLQGRGQTKSAGLLPQRKMSQ
jgi:hypothetical protein